MTAIAAPPARSSLPLDQQESLANTYQRLMLMLLLFLGATALIVGVRIQRLQSLTEADARAEGTEALYQSSALLPGVPLQTAFALTWCERYGSHAWAANPWVWVVEFRGAQSI